MGRLKDQPEKAKALGTRGNACPRDFLNRTAAPVVSLRRMSMIAASGTVVLRIERSECTYKKHRVNVCNSQRDYLQA